MPQKDSPSAVSLGSYTYNQIFAFMRRYPGLLQKDGGVWRYDYRVQGIEIPLIVEKAHAESPELAVVSMPSFQEEAGNLRAVLHLDESEGKRLMALFGKFEGWLLGYVDKTNTTPARKCRGQEVYPPQRHYWKAVIGEGTSFVNIADAKISPESAMKSVVDSSEARMSSFV